MNLNQKHEKFTKIISYTTPENFLESLTAIEYNLHQPAEESKSLAPNEANFQLPNVFLKTRNNFEIEKLLGKSNLEDNWNAKIDKAIEFLDRIELDQKEFEEPGVFDDKILETLIKYMN